MNILCNGMAYHLISTVGKLLITSLPSLSLHMTPHNSLLSPSFRSALCQLGGDVRSSPQTITSRLFTNRPLPSKVTVISFHQDNSHRFTQPSPPVGLNRLPYCGEYGINQLALAEDSVLHRGAPWKRVGTQRQARFNPGLFLTSTTQVRGSPALHCIANVPR